MTVDLHALGARVVSVCGPFNSRVMFDMPAEAAQELFPMVLVEAGRTDVVDGTQRDLDALREVSPDLADSGLAAMALQMASEIEDPYNGATAKSNCGKVLMDAMATLRSLAPAKERTDGISRIADELAERRRQSGDSADGGAASADLPRP